MSDCNIRTSRVKEKLGRKVCQARASVSNKRGTSRSHLSANMSLKYWQSIFASRVLRDLFSGKIFINVDESSFTKSVRSDYSWLPVGENHPIINTWGTGRAIVLFALVSNGEWLWFVSKNKTDSKMFWNFLKLLSNYVESWIGFLFSDSELLLDNASVHTSAMTRQFIEKLGIRMRFLPQYSPKLAPVEIVFGMLKSKLKAKKGQQIIKYSLISGRKKICQALSGFSKEKALNLWSVFIDEAKIAILQWRRSKLMSQDKKIKKDEKPKGWKHEH